MLKLKTVYPYGLHYRIEEKGQNKSECEDLTRNAFPNLSLPKWDTSSTYQKRKRLIRLTH